MDIEAFEYLNVIHLEKEDEKWLVCMYFHAKHYNFVFNVKNIIATRLVKNASTVDPNNF